MVIVNPGALAASPHEIFEYLSSPFGIETKQVALAARFLREDSVRRKIDMWPSVKPGRGENFEISPLHAAYLVIALATSPAAAQAPAYARYYGLLECREEAEMPHLAGVVAILIAEKITSRRLEFWITRAFADVRIEESGESKLDRFQAKRREDGLEYLPPWAKPLINDIHKAVDRMCVVPGTLIGGLGALFVSVHSWRDGSRESKSKLLTVEPDKRPIRDAY